ncbi:hypothetical protein GLOTRDRAFT_132479 [Gloeophyllum trabeum ATCC 11539]|uniref:Uncharacterized protein n=1 Tax=Gloeophyllum trabeum (strain ATCC 11539 / FP-39264 / Madison 617) TaxID=670483 RepID=S7PXM7_GLOTA|nr:uncharacterized protein GLOTRDRAFT_132479 [Gloeophyllum trabeum ATCC 11539]EPQ52366.1 hypothetical protein GLOTRDRAFT_132479 [Gloeophyllum trabeum ATCC 11539]
MDATEFCQHVDTDMTGTQSGTSLHGVSQPRLHDLHDFKAHVNDEVMDIPPRSPSRLGVRQSPQSPQSRKEAAVNRSGPYRPTLQRRNSEIGRDRHSYTRIYESTESDTDTSFCSTSDSDFDQEDDSDTSDSSADDEFIFDAFFTPKPIRASTPPPEEHLPTLPPAAVYQPSPLSPHGREPHTRMATTHPRHAYPHRGMSRSSLMYTKYFWQTRHEEWQEWEAQVEESQAAAGAYDGIAVPPKAPPRGPPRNGATFFEPPQTSYHRFLAADPNSPIYPRAGDLSDLRSGHSVHLDRWFCFFPLYKIHQKLFRHDMEHRVKGTSSGSNSPQPDDDASDVTLVADMSNENNSGIAEDESLDDLINVGLGSPVRPKPTAKRNSRPWETNWVLRWEKFAEILRDEAMAKAAAIAVERRPRATTPDDVHAVKSTGKFYFEEADEESDGTDGTESDEDDYGVLMSNPMFTRPLGFGFHSFTHDIFARSAPLEVQANLICA